MLISELKRISGNEMIDKYSISGIYHFPTLFFGNGKNRAYGCEENSKFENIDIASSPNYILKIRNAIVIDGPQKIIDYEDKTWLTDPTLDPNHSFSNPQMVEDFRRCFDQKFPNTGIQLKGKSLLIEAKWSNNYYHFTIDCLGKAMIALRELDLKDFDQIIVRNLNINFVIDYFLKFNILGLDKPKFVQLNLRQAYICDYLYGNTPAG